MTTSIDPDELPPSRDTFGGQTPIALVAIAAVGAILLVNTWTGPAGARRDAAPAPIAGWSECSACGEVVHINERSTASGSGLARFEVEVRMRNGALRTVQQAAPGLMIGDRVRLTDGRLTLQE